MDVEKQPVSHYTSGQHYNAIFILESLGVGELKTGRHLSEGALSAFCTREGIGHEFFEVRSRSEFYDVLSAIRTACRNRGILPIVHLELHGSKEDGLQIAQTNEFVSWPEVTALCREINIACANNLLLTLGCCWGYVAITEASLNAAAPFCSLVAPSAEVTAGEVERYQSFYRTLITTNDITAATKELPNAFRLFLAERLLFEALRELIARRLVGRAKREAIEDLLTQFRQTTAGRRMAIVDARAVVKENLRTLEQRIEKLYKRYQRSYLLGNDKRNAGRFSIALSEIMEVVRLHGTRSRPVRKTRSKR